MSNVVLLNERHVTGVARPFGRAANGDWFPRQEKISLAYSRAAGLAAQTPTPDHYTVNEDTMVLVYN